MANFCSKCGTKVDPSWSACAKCGNPLGVGGTPQRAPSQQLYQQSYQQPYRTSAMGETSTRSPSALVLGIIGIFFSVTYIFFVPIGIVIGLVALIIGVVYVFRDKQKVFALIGLIFGAVAMIMGFFRLWMYWFVLVA